MKLDVSNLTFPTWFAKYSLQSVKRDMWSKSSSSYYCFIIIGMLVVVSSGRHLSEVHAQNDLSDRYMPTDATPGKICLKDLGASAQGAGGRPPPQKNWDGGGAPLPQTKKHRKAQKNDESALRAKEVIYYQCVTGVTRPPNQNLVPTPLGFTEIVGLVIHEKIMSSCFRILFGRRCTMSSYCVALLCGYFAVDRTCKSRPSCHGRCSVSTVIGVITILHTLVFYCAATLNTAYTWILVFRRLVILCNTVVLQE